MRNQNSKQHPATRSGLAPLELVVALPLLLSVMALIVNFAHVATWKVRTATNARLAMWRHRPKWNADDDPKPSNFWPKGASMTVYTNSRISELDPLWNQPAIAQGWIKGPVFSANGGYLGLRDNRVNEMSEGVSQGAGNLNLKYPFMPSMGSISLDVRHTLLDTVWQQPWMGRRAKGWWKLEDAPEWDEQKRVFLQAVGIIMGNPQRELMRPLDRDYELEFNGYPHDFYAFANGNHCNNDPDSVRKNDIIAEGGLVDRIQGRRSNPHVRGVCEHMATTYRRMFQDQLGQVITDLAVLEVQLAQLQSQLGQVQLQCALLQTQLGQLQTQLAQLQSAVPPDAAQIAQIQAQISQIQAQGSQSQSLVGPLEEQIASTQAKITDLKARKTQLEKWIEQLTDFIGTL